MEEKSLNKNGFSYPRNTVAKSILWALYPIGVYFAASLIVGMVFAFVIAFKIVLGGQELALDEYTSLIYSYSGIILVAQQVISLAATLPIFLVHRKYISKPEKKNTASSVLLGVMFVLGCCAVISIIQSLIFSLFSINDMAWAETQEILVSMSFLLQIISTVILAPIVEELMFRGMIMNRLMSVFPKWVSVAVSALAFGVFHLNLTQGVFATLVGLVIGFIYLKTRSISVCILAHAANNLYSTLISYVEFSRDIYAFLADAALAVIMLIPVVIVWAVKRRKSVSDN